MRSTFFACRAFCPVLVLFGAVLLSLNPSLARATLGGHESSIDADQRALHASQKDILIHDLYQVREIETSGQIVREYISSDGTVFAVTWSGTSAPDLAQLLGTYYTEFVESSSSPTRIRPAALFAEQSGYLKQLKGRAYLPRLVPKGVDPGEIR